MHVSLIQLHNVRFRARARRNGHRDLAMASSSHAQLIENSMPRLARSLRQQTCHETEYGESSRREDKFDLSLISSATTCSPHLFLVVSCHEQHKDDDRSLEHVYFNRLIHTGTALAAVTAICSAARADLQQHNWEMS